MIGFSVPSRLLIKVQSNSNMSEVAALLTPAWPGGMSGYRAIPDLTG